MIKANFTAKVAKNFRTIANKEHKGMNAAIRTLKGVWESNDTDLNEAIEACKNDGLTIDDFSAEYILENLAGTKWVNEGAILMNKKGQMVGKTTWTPGQVVDYVRRANNERLRKVNAIAKDVK